MKDINKLIRGGNPRAKSKSVQMSEIEIPFSGGLAPIQSLGDLEDNSKLSKFNVSLGLKSLHSSAEITTEDIINLIPFGKFHISLAAIYFINFITNSFLCYNYSYILLIPKYLCLNEAGTYESCENDYICDQ